MHKRISKVWMVTVFLLVAVPLSATNVLASTIAVGVGAFGLGSTLSTFIAVPSGTEVNGLTVDGIQYSYSLGNGQMFIANVGGPGATNNLALPYIISAGNPTGILTLQLPSSVDTFGYGYALAISSSIANATTISLFQGVSPVGTLSYNGAPDPIFSGGFAGIQSTLPFNRVQLTFSVASPAFVLDNVRTFNSPASAVPESSGLLFLGAGFTFMVLYLRKRGERFSN